MSPSSTRWCPTPEQVMILEELYKRGLRTPNAVQIQKITAHLACFGRIQGKNVFYWFQNHKARDRQKLRKKIHLHQQFHQNYPFAFYPQTPLLLPPPPPPQFIPNFYSPQHLQGTEMRSTKQQEEEENWWMGSSSYYGHDSTTIMGVDPTFHPSCSSRPLETLELFPLTPPTPHTSTPAAVAGHWKP